MSSKPLEGKIGVVFGVANKRSIAWAIAQAWAAAGANLIFNYQGERLKENVEDLVSLISLRCDKRLGDFGVLSEGSHPY
jgi:enoyl-[acyl-carrier-protein] reductase (NADH)